MQMKSNETFSSFSTTFIFSIAPPRSELGRHIIAFILTPYTSPQGLLNFTSNGQPYNDLLAVEFDTSKNVEFDDPDDNNVGVDINSLASVKTETVKYWNGEDFHGFSLKRGRNIKAWIDYNHIQSQINITIMVVGLPRQQISLKIDLDNILQEKMFVSFAAATRNFVEDHYIMAWSFTTDGMAASLDISHLPSFANTYSKSPSLGFITGVTVVALVLLSLVLVAVILNRAKNRETIEEWEKEFWPHIFAYKDLSITKNRFREENILGHGGFGKVYRGVLPRTG